MEGLYLGLDTSNYTTSIALVDEKEQVVLDKRKIIQVKKGERGIRQSEAVFQHINNLSQLIEEIENSTINKNILGVCSSTCPRPTEKSYMPVFNVSKTMGQAIAKFLKVPFYSTSHQEGHIMAGIWSSQGTIGEKFITVHLSGGTTEILMTQRQQKGFREEIIGGSQDLNAGQFIDRVGVALGLNFPSGPELEHLAMKGSKGGVIIPSSVSGNKISFSGPETKAQNLIAQNCKDEDIALGVIHCIAKSLEKVIMNIVSTTKITDILFVGGVASNKHIKNHLVTRLKLKGIQLYFCQPRYSTDNSVGVALMGRAQHQNR
ncbi:O-sialoglycoprotein endopeptidase [Irregularibacter muris]|uniref:N(6)-L-threonylcarbamoyladenine synthase n=1 Tax=Irregularibacter muris TaxID=1796619 RepID=A0AAE3HEH6_9FIRM|nr:O-sialoglycoprotein endopeptidase [Irregularibacter muris]MCR1897997.1 O-sialoglycoprotein endopeptidase [Irregularibacter muris]